MTLSDRYSAYISYSHHDEVYARRLQGRLETYRVPRHLVRAGFPARLSRVFRDRSDLPSSSSLREELKAALADSDALIVVCSPAAAASEWVREEILEFKRIGPDRPILPVVVSGEPPGCFPSALVGSADGIEEALEPLAADARPGGDGDRDSLLKLIAGLLGVGFDELKRRDAHRQHRRMATFAGLSTTLAVIMAVLFVVAVAAREDAERRRAQAEDLLSFMIGDLRSQLEPLGRLDILGAVGDEAMDFYGGLEGGDLTDSVLATRTQVLRQIGEVRVARGELENARAAFAQSLELAGELAGRNPEQLDLLFDLGQAHFWIAYVDYASGALDAAEENFTAYDEIARHLVAASPGTLDYELEVVYAKSNLGTLAMSRDDLDAAARHFEDAVTMNRQILERRPDDTALLHDLAEGLSWLGAVAHEGAEPLDAIEWYRETLALRHRLVEADPDKNFDEHLCSTQQLLAVELYLVGETGPATDMARDSFEVSAELVSHDPTNAEWARIHTASQRLLGWMLMDTDPVRAMEYIHASVEGLETLLAEDPSNSLWRDDMARSLLLLARVSLLNEDIHSSVEAARRGIALTDEQPAGDRAYGELHVVLGDALWADGQHAEARDSWDHALTVMRPAERSREPLRRNALALALARTGAHDEAPRRARPAGRRRLRLC